MTTRDILINNIQQFNLVVHPDDINTVGSIRCFDKPNSVKVLNSHHNDKQLKDFMEFLDKRPTDNSYIESVSFKDYGFKLPNGRYWFESNINDFIEPTKSTIEYNNLIIKCVKNNPNLVSYCYIVPNPTMICSIDPSDYDSSKESQEELLSYLVMVCGSTIYGDICECPYEQEYQYRDIDRTGDHGLLWGEYPGIDEDEHFDGRLDNYNDSVISDFYDFEFDDMFSSDSYLNDIDPGQNITICHRKGKDFYLNYSLTPENVSFIYKEDNFEYDYDEYDEIEFYFSTQTVDKYLMDKVLSYLSGSKEYLEIKSYVYNELKIKEDHQYKDNVFSVNVLKVIFNGEISEIAWYILDKIDYNKQLSSLKKQCIDINDRILSEHITYKVNGSMVVNCVDDTMITFNHIRVIKKLQRHFGYIFGYGCVNPHAHKTQHEYSTFIQIGDEQYHFDEFEYLDSEQFCHDEGPVVYTDYLVGRLIRRVLLNTFNNDIHSISSKLFVSFDDSVKAGNCVPGTNAFIAEHGIDLNHIGGIRGDVLLEYQDSNLVRNAIVQAYFRIKKDFK